MRNIAFYLLIAAVGVPLQILVSMCTFAASSIVTACYRFWTVLRQCNPTVHVMHGDEGVLICQCRDMPTAPNAINMMLPLSGDTERVARGAGIVFLNVQSECNDRSARWG